ncbi:unnamed protein product [Boreogadus saida]
MCEDGSNYEIQTGSNPTQRKHSLVEQAPLEKGNSSKQNNVLALWSSGSRHPELLLVAVITNAGFFNRGVSSELKRLLSLIQYKVCSLQQIRYTLTYPGSSTNRETHISGYPP